MPRVRGINEGVDTTPGPPKDTDREDEEGSTQAPVRDTDVAITKSGFKLVTDLPTNFCDFLNQVTVTRPCDP